MVYIKFAINKNKIISVFIDSEKEAKDEKIFISEFGKKPPHLSRVKNEKPLFGDNIISDIRNRPDEPDLREYEIAPVSSFGISLLKGMGWVEGQPIGLTNKGLSQPIEFIPRPHGLGLGAENKIDYLEQKAALSKKNKNFSGPIYNKDGKARHYKGIHEKSPLQTGPQARITKGKYGGLTATLITIDKTLLTGKLRIDKSNEVIILSQKEFEIIRDVSENKINNTLEPLTWAALNLHVRIIDHCLEGGKYFNTKARIVNVIKDTCTIIVDGSENRLCRIHDSSLETIVPKTIGSRVMVIIGKYRGKIGKIIARHSKKYLAT
ncbi:hypothetical protein HZS_5676, partial [Henneguya salminicola]